MTTTLRIPIGGRALEFHSATAGEFGCDRCRSCERTPRAGEQVFQNVYGDLRCEQCALREATPTLRAHPQAAGVLFLDLSRPYDRDAMCIGTPWDREFASDFTWLGEHGAYEYAQVGGSGGDILRRRVEFWGSISMGWRFESSGFDALQRAGVDMSAWDTPVHVGELLDAL